MLRTLSLLILLLFSSFAVAQVKKPLSSKDETIKLNAKILRLRHEMHITNGADAISQYCYLGLDNFEFAIGTSGQYLRIIKTFQDQGKTISSDLSSYYSKALREKNAQKKVFLSNCLKTARFLFLKTQEMITKKTVRKPLSKIHSMLENQSIELMSASKVQLPGKKCVRALATFQLSATKLGMKTPYPMRSIADKYRKVWRSMFSKKDSEKWKKEHKEAQNEVNQLKGEILKNCFAMAFQGYSLNGFHIGYKRKVPARFKNSNNNKEGKKN